MDIKIMNLQSLIRPELWTAISDTYEAGNYTHAIRDAFQYMTEIIREKSGLDGDGEQLVGKAFGGESPKLRINKLQTVTERDIQQGLLHILIGMYKGIRNPRSHDQIEDTKKSADAIIYFIDYLLGVIDQSQELFTIPSFVSRVFDKHFVQTSKYTKLLVEEIPPKKRFDVLVEIYRKKQEEYGLNLALVVKEILKVISEEQTTQFLELVSDELKTTQDYTILGLILQILPPNLWKKLNKTARLRVENILIKSIDEGEANKHGDLVAERGRLGTSAKGFIKYFESKDDLQNVILKKLEQNDAYEKMYVYVFFLDELPDLFEDSFLEQVCIKSLCDIVKEDISNFGFEERLIEAYRSFPEDWQNIVKNELPYLDMDDDIPF
jgi:uncharacterized protein (TIGR02391 family)